MTASQAPALVVPPRASLPPRERLIVALDLPNVSAAAAMVERLGDSVSFYKIGLELVYAGGLSFARDLISSGKQVFLDLKFHDIPNTVQRATEQVAGLGATYLTVHAEAPIHLHRTLQAIRKLGMKSGVALNPATPLTAIEYVLDEADLMLLMTVNPGFGGQKLIDAVIPKVRALRSLLSERQLHSLIQVDGGVTTDNVETLVAAGVDIVVAGSTVFNSPDSRATIEQLRASGRLNRV
jgi:ribulose-phosphate 3-epimerase